MGTGTEMKEWAIQAKKKHNNNYQGGTLGEPWNWPRPSKQEKLEKKAKHRAAEESLAMDIRFFARFIGLRGAEWGIGATDIMMVQQGDGTWDIPGGKQKGKEQDLQTIVREVWEETGVFLDERTLTRANLTRGYLDEVRGIRWLGSYGYKLFMKSEREPPGPRRGDT